jgi:hypothetical protein
LDFSHYLFGHGMLMLAFLLWQIHERHLVCFEVLHGLEYLWPIELVQPGD